MPTRPGRRTVAIVRYLKALGPLPRRRVMPRQQQPDAIRASYYRDVLPYALVGARSMNREADEIVRLVADERRLEAARRGEKMDASNRERALELVRRAAERAARQLNASEKEIAAVARKHGRATSIFQREQLNRQTKAALSVPLVAVEPVVVEKLDGFAAENVDLIVTVSDRYFDRIRLDVLEAFETGMRPETMAESFVERMGMSENDAMRIARDQIGKLNGQLNMERQKGMGVTGYTWRGVRDNRERDEHVEREGEHFTWDNPPPDGHPGEPIQCRCYAEPDFDDIMSGVRA